MGRTLIVGGVAGGATAAARLRRRNENEEIIIFERGEYISYANCGLPYFVGDVIKNRDALLLQTPEKMKAWFNIEVRVRNEVIAIHPERHAIEVKDLETLRTYEESYDNLILATGSSPLKPPIPGIDSEGIFTVWTVPDTDRIKAYIGEQGAKSAAIIGGGFIGLEMAENLHELNLEVSLIEAQSQVMAPVDMELANILHHNMRQNGVELVLGDGVKSFARVGEEVTVTLSSGRVIKTDMVILSIGVRPNSKLAEEAGIELNKRGGIIVDQSFMTSAKDVYAVGDVIEVTSPVTGDKTMVPLAGPANKEARILADILVNDRKTYRGTMGTSVAKVFDYNVAAVGLNEKALIAMGKIKDQDYYRVLINQKSHAGYYPGASMIFLKMLFDREGKILGAQIVGQDGVDKRIDTIATIMKMGGNVHDLAELELSYAPPFSSAKDPVNMLGFVAENMLDGLVSFVFPSELETLDNTVLLDVRENIEVEAFAIENAVNIPLGKLRERIDELDKSKHIVVICAVGVRANNAARILTNRGFDKVSILVGGASFYRFQLSGTEEKENVNKPLNITRDEVKMDKAELELDCCGLQCPGPIMQVYKAMETMKEGEVLKVCATDMGFAPDVESWCRRTKNTFLRVEKDGNRNIVYIRKGQAEDINKDVKVIDSPEGKSIIVFSGDLDKVLASFIIANGAASMGRPVTMFFTFWGLNVLRKTNSPKVKKNLIEKMFGMMMPKGSTKLKLSKMNMGGMGTAMMKMVMKKKNVSSLEELMDQAKANGVKLCACTMSMDIMGIKKEELIDGVEYVGVASYLGDAEESNVNLFI